MVRADAVSAVEYVPPAAHFMPEEKRGGAYTYAQYEGE
jgi:hypothetical protein